MQLERLRATTVPLHLSVSFADDWLEAIAFGMVIDGRPDSQLVEVSRDVRYVRRSARGAVIGFVVGDLSTTELPDAVFGGPRFAVPALGVDHASLGEIALAARTACGTSTADVLSFERALEAAEEDGNLQTAADHWRACLQAGDMRGHFGLGYTLFDLGRPHAAYGHLRRYTELAPHNSWAWLWLGRAAEAIDEPAEAVAAYRRAIRREREGSFKTDAVERLRVLQRTA